MYRIHMQDDETMVVESYPLFLVSLVALLGAIIFVSWLLGKAELDVMGWIIVCGVLSVFVLIHKYRKTVIKRGSGVLFETRGVLGGESTEVPIGDISRIEMMFGRGSGYAKGGALVLFNRDEKIFSLIDSDVNPGSAKKAQDAMDRIKAFLET